MTAGFYCSPDPAAGAEQNPFCALQQELTAGLKLYWQSAAQILEDSGIRLAHPTPEAFSLERNFFSALFLYSYFRCGIVPERRIFYAAVNQCLRGMVTGCDNLLDDEYKPTLETDLPPGAARFRSVLDIMVSERVLFELLLSRLERTEVSARAVRKALRNSLHALTRSGAQEASEEGGVHGRRLPPQEVLSTVHHYKTGLLFQCPWAVPGVIESPLPEDAASVNEALYRIGIGCQILDDMVDLGRDVHTRRHNFVASLIEWGETPAKQRMLADLAGSGGREELSRAFSHILWEANETAMGYLKDGLGRLLNAAHRAFVNPAAAFIAARIGADRLLTPGERGRA